MTASLQVPDLCTDVSSTVHNTGANVRPVSKLEQPWETGGNRDEWNSQDKKVWQAWREETIEQKQWVIEMNKRACLFQSYIIKLSSISVQNSISIIIIFIWPCTWASNLPFWPHHRSAQQALSWVPAPERVGTAYADCSPKTHEKIHSLELYIFFLVSITQG